MKKLLLLVLATFMVTQLHAQFDHDFLEHKANESDLVVIGKVIEKESFWNSNRTQIFTSNKIEILGRVKGDAPNVIEVITYGGEADSTYQVWLHELTIPQNAKGYFFLKQDRTGYAKSDQYYVLNGEDSFIPLPKKQTPDITSGNFSMTDKVIEFGFDNIQIQQVNELSFDILVKTNAAGVGLEFGYGDILAQYSSQVFGLNVNSNDRLDVFKEVVITDPAYSLLTEDFASDIFKTVISGGCDSITSSFSAGIPLTTEFQKLLAVTMEIQDLTALGTISLDEFQMDGNVHYYDPSTGNCLPFDDIIYPNPIETGLVCNITGFMSDLDPVNPDRTAAGTDNILTITGMNFEAMPGSVEFQNADDVVPPIVLASTHVVDFNATAGGSWGTQQIQVRVPSTPVTAGTGVFQVRTASGMVCVSPAPLEICYSAITFRTGANEVKKIYSADYPDNNGQLEFRLEDDLQNNANALNSIETTICDWNAQTNVDWNLGAIYDNEDLVTGDEMSPAVDNVNHIFMAPAGVFATNPGANMRTIITSDNRIQTCVDFTQNPPPNFNHTTDIDIAVRQDLNTMVPPVPAGWNFHPVNLPVNDPVNPANNELDFYSIILHELGHAHILDHALVDADKRMYPNTTVGETRRILHPKDGLGGNYILDISDAVLNNANTNCPTAVGRNGICAVPVIEVESVNDLKIFPNPFSTHMDIAFSLESANKVVITLYDLFGNKVLSNDSGLLFSGDHSLRIDLTSSRAQF